MNVNGIGAATGSTAGTSGMTQKEDSVTRMLKRQLEAEQKKLRELSGNSKLSEEEKAKERQEIQKQITELNRQLREHQNEMRQEEAEKVKEKQQQKEEGAAGLSKGSMQALISADAAAKQARVQGSVAGRMEGRAGVLEIEIKLDKDRGGQAERKEEELSKVKEKAQQAESAQFGTLREAEEMLKASGAEETKDSDDVKKSGKTEAEKEEEEKNAEKHTAEEIGEEREGRRYGKIDVRL